MYIECTAACNISCTDACCAPETGITRTRQAGMLDFDLFRGSSTKPGPSLGRIDFFNYGEAFLHKRAIEMCEYIKSNFPHIYLYTSTNGLAFTEEQARRLVHSGIDEVTFSIDGATQASYEQYRQRGKFDVALRESPGDGRREAASGPRPAVPELALHPVHVERQRRGDGAARGSSRRTSASIGCAGRSPTIPEDAFSRRFVPGSADFERIRRETWDDNNLGNAIPGATPRARIDVRTPVPGLPLVGARRRPLRSETRVQNLSTRLPQRGHLRPAAGPARRAIVRRGRRADQPRLRARRAAAAARPAATAADDRIELPALPTPGRYALKFDLVNEGVDWFERCGSPTTTTHRSGSLSIGKPG